MYKTPLALQRRGQREWDAKKFYLPNVIKPQIRAGMFSQVLPSKIDKRMCALVEKFMCFRRNRWCRGDVRWYREGLNGHSINLYVAGIFDADIVSNEDTWEQVRAQQMANVQLGTKTESKRLHQMKTYLSLTSGSVPALAWGDYINPLIKQWINVMEQWITRDVPRLSESLTFVHRQWMQNRQAGGLWIDSVAEVTFCSPRHRTTVERHRRRRHRRSSEMCWLQCIHRFAAFGARLQSVTTLLLLIGNNTETFSTNWSVRMHDLRLTVMGRRCTST